MDMAINKGHLKCLSYLMTNYSWNWEKIFKITKKKILK